MRIPTKITKYGKLCNKNVCIWNLCIMNRNCIKPEFQCVLPKQICKCQFQNLVYDWLIKNMKRVFKYYIFTK
jgi:hypothetical protein